MATATVLREPRIAAEDLAHDLGLIRAAISLIAAGGADRVTLIGMRGAERLLPRAQAMSLEAGLHARAEWPSDGNGCDITVEAIQ